jgi:hypothetical protein
VKLAMDVTAYGYRAFLGFRLAGDRDLRGNEFAYHWLHI